MNRLKVGVYAALAVAVALAPALLVSTTWTAHEIARADATLRAAEALVQAHARELAHGAVATARQVAAVPAVQEVAGAQGDLQAAALAAATGIVPATGGRVLLVAAGGGGLVSQQLAGSEAPFAGEPRVTALVSDVAADGHPREALVRAGEQLFAVGVVRVAAGAGLAVGQPVNVLALAPPRELGRVELYAQGWRGASASGPAPQGLLAAAQASPGLPVGVGRLGHVAVLPSPCPPLPASFLRAPAYRALLLPVPGAPGAAVIAAVELRPLLAPAVAVAWASIAGAVLLLGFGLLALWGVTDEQRTVVPRSLVNVADRIARGDFAARAPALAGSLGTLSAALNRAAGAAVEARQQAARPAPPAPVARTGAAPLGAVDPGPDAAEPAAPPAAPPPRAPDFFAPPEGAAPPEPPGLAEDPAPAREAAPPPPAAAAEEVSSVTAAVATAAGPRREITDELADRPAEDEDEAHWQAVFGDFLRVRGECGEPQAGVTYPRFREKLQANRAQLVSKYACRTVRFQVYVKDGKAALKASPVR